MPELTDGDILYDKDGKIVGIAQYRGDIGAFTVMKYDPLLIYLGKDGFMPAEKIPDRAEGHTE